MSDASIDDVRGGCGDRNRGDDGGRDDRGRDARRPSDIPKRGWKDVLFRVKEEIKQDHVAIISAGVAFFGVLAIFPALLAIISIYGLLTSPEEAARQIQEALGFLPDDATSLINEQVTKIAGSQDSTLGTGAIVGLLAALWSASSGMKALNEGMNVAYDEPETRGFLKKRGIAILMTLGGLVVVIFALIGIVGVPALIANLNWATPLEVVISVGTVLVVAALFVVALAFVYRIGPNRDNPEWRWVSWGAVIATILWLIGSAAFSFYVDNFGTYNETYGSVAGVIVLLLWLFLSAFMVMLGAEINAELEHQTARDSTEGQDRPLGQRGAEMADTVGEPAESRKR
jgi:membrane protein